MLQLHTSERVISPHTKVGATGPLDLPGRQYCHAFQEAMSSPKKAGIAIAKGLLDSPEDQYCLKSEEAMSSPEGDMRSPEADMSSPEGGMSSPEGDMSSPEGNMSSPTKAGITAAKGLLDLPGGEYWVPLKIISNDT